MWEVGAPVAPQSADTDPQADIDEINASKSLRPTDKKRLVNARLRQGEFRDSLVRYWRGTCPLTGCSDPRMLTASHIKQWVDSAHEEKLDPYNGILLAPNADRLFDRFLITFDENWGLVVSPTIDTESLRAPWDSRERDDSRQGSAWTLFAVASQAVGQVNAPTSTRQVKSTTSSTPTGME